MSATDPFALLGLPRAQAIDGADLDRRLRERARSVHPDRAAPGDRLRAVDASARLHAAHRTLKDPLARAGALLALAGRTALAPPAAPFLEAQLAAREALEDARERGDGDEVARVLDEARAALDACAASLDALLVPAAPEASLDRAAGELVRARFHARLVREEEGALAGTGRARGG